MESGHMKTLTLKAPLNKVNRPTDLAYTALQHRLSNYNRGKAIMVQAWPLSGMPVTVWARGQITAVLR